VTSSVTLAEVHTARHLYLRFLNFCNAEMVLCIYGYLALRRMSFRRMSVRRILSFRYIARGYAAYECRWLIILQGYEPLPFMSWPFTSWTQWTVGPIQRTYTNTNSQLRP